MLGVDPDPRMADFARRQGLEVEVATVETWESSDRTFDAVIAGQAWHWVDPVAGAATAARVLRPGGRLAVFWNVFQPSSDLAEAISAVYHRVLPDSPFARGTMPGLDSYAPFLTKAAEGMGKAGAFGDPEQWRFDWDRAYDRDEWLDVVPTFGGHSQFPPGTLEELLAGIGSAIDAAGGSFTMRLHRGGGHGGENRLHLTRVPRCPVGRPVTRLGALGVDYIVAPADLPEGEARGVPG